MSLIPTASQTVGPFFHLELTDHGSLGQMADKGARGERIRLHCRVLDGDGAPVPDAMIELWQANAEGKYDHPEDPQAKQIDPVFHGYGRLPTREDGTCTFETIKPGRVPAPGGRLQAPHINVSIFARGLLKQLTTRIYFVGDSANDEDMALALVPRERRNTLMAQMDSADSSWRFEVHLCGDNETVFFNL
jgi:protocatechuate 3,4-dioxygenase alpha subunit